jgi:hypothetical protein
MLLQTEDMTIIIILVVLAMMLVNLTACLFMMARRRRAQASFQQIYGNSPPVPRNKSIKTLSGKNKCDQCGTENIGNAVFCVKCGARLL